jgi:hypothetical protein
LSTIIAAFFWPVNILDNSLVSLLARARIRWILQETRLPKKEWLSSSAWHKKAEESMLEGHP